MKNGPAERPQSIPMKNTNTFNSLSLIIVASLMLRLAAVLGAVAVEPCSLGIGMAFSNRLSNGVAA